MCRRSDTLSRAPLGGGSRVCAVLGAVEPCLRGHPWRSLGAPPKLTRVRRHSWRSPRAPLDGGCRVCAAFSGGRLVRRFLRTRVTVFVAAVGVSVVTLISVLWSVPPPLRRCAFDGVSPFRRWRQGASHFVSPSANSKSDGATEWRVCDSLNREGCVKIFLSKFSEIFRFGNFGNFGRLGSFLWVGLLAVRCS